MANKVPKGADTSKPAGRETAAPTMSWAQAAAALGAARGAAPGAARGAAPKVYPFTPQQHATLLETLEGGGTTAMAARSAGLPLADVKAAMFTWTEQGAELLRADLDNLSRLATSEDERIARLRAREIIRRVLDMVERCHGNVVDYHDRATCHERLASMYATAIGFSLKQAMRMKFVEALVRTAVEATRAHGDFEREAEWLGVKYEVELNRNNFSPEELQEMLVPRPDEARDADMLAFYLSRSLPDRCDVLHNERLWPLATAAVAAIARTEGQHRRPGEGYKWPVIARLINEVGLGPVAATTLPVDWSRWKRARRKKVATVGGKKPRGRPRRSISSAG